MSDKDQRKVPLLRFKGFTNDWEQRKLKELAIFNPKDNLPEEFEYVDLESVIGTEMLSHKKTALSDAPSRAQRLAKKGDIFYQTVRPYQKNDYLFDKDAENYVFSTGYAQIRPKINGNFLFQLLRTERFVKKVLNECTGTSYPAINSKDLSNIKVSYTNYKEEQRSIGSLLDNLDNLVALQQRKLDRLLLLKKAYLTNLLPDKTQNPKVRFKEFNDKWKKLKLGNISSISAGGDVNKQKLLKKGRYPVIANALTNKGVIGYYESKYRIQAPAVTVTGRGDIGHAYARKTNFTPVVRLLSVKSKHNVDFLAEAINQKKVPFESTGVPQLTVPKLSNYKILFPSSITEENKIGNFIIKFDEIINLQNKKISSLEQVKNFLLQNMFI